ncbi:DUF4232 domain-containing protein [Yinghuangia sp. YIM S09857]|uniref:DUF4232 domain-containing protein n=1 Tax=Yinghuangia sp. YIM S09857 TaxID=3436929 RepID=UPI003F535D14
MSARLARTRLFAATTVALATFALTACNNGDDNAAGAGASSPVPAPSAPAGATSGVSPAPSPSGAATTGAGTAGSGAASGNGGTSQGSTASGGTNGSGSSGKSGGNTSSGGSNGGSSSDDSDVPPNFPDCGASNTKTTATVVARPLNHLLLTVTNTGAKNCYLVGYPAARFGEAQAVPPVDDSTKPQAVVTLAPGESGYAGVRLSATDGSGENGYTTSSLTLPFDDGSIADVPLPAAGVYVDTALRVTYWQQTLDLALS